METAGRTAVPTDGRGRTGANGRERTRTDTDGRKDERMDGRTDGRMDKRTEGWTRTAGRGRAWTDMRTGGCTGRTDERTNGQTSNDHEIMIYSISVLLNIKINKKARIFDDTPFQRTS